VDQSTSRRRDVRLIVGAVGISALGDFLLALWTPLVVLAPALVIWAADDRFFPREHGRGLADLLPQGRFELVRARGPSSPRTTPQHWCG
jgi:pimeloyl-ACP methyl ester carboxylesterase